MILKHVEILTSEQGINSGMENAHFAWIYDKPENAIHSEIVLYFNTFRDSI